MSTQARPAGIRASHVSRQLADACHERAKWADNDHSEWSPGYRVEQCGEDVIVSCEGPRGRVDVAAEERQLADYALALTNLGYSVETVPREEMDGDGGRSKLVVSRYGSTKIEQGDVR